MHNNNFHKLANPGRWKFGGNFLFQNTRNLREQTRRVGNQGKGPGYLNKVNHRTGSKKECRRGSFTWVLLIFRSSLGVYSRKKPGGGGGGFFEPLKSCNIQAWKQKGYWPDEIERRVFSPSLGFSFSLRKGYFSNTRRAENLGEY